MAEYDPLTRVEPMSEARWKRPIVGPMAHGPEKSWDQIGVKANVACTVRVELLRLARSRGVNLSGALEATLEKMVGGSDLAAIEEELRGLTERSRILEAARDKLRERRANEESAAAGEAARIAEVRKIADAFFGSGRGDPARFTRAANLRWIEGRLARSRCLKGDLPEGILQLVLSSRPAEVPS